MKIFILFFAVFFIKSSYALNGAELAVKNACLSCHNVERHSKSAPSYKKISEKYKNQNNSLKYIMGKIRSGGKGVWNGSRAGMPAFPKIEDQELKILAEWILSLQ
tara:strand:+ start:286 stop:600 length:315 start_codon:yes stop_codon:yes gene_type:complete